LELVRAPLARKVRMPVRALLARSSTPGVRTHYSFGCFLTTFGSFVLAVGAASPDPAAPALGLCVFGFGRRLPKVPRWIFPRFDL